MAPHVIAVKITMTLVELRYLVAVDQEQHFGRAASACGVSQPALSNAIQNLERELDVTLFERSRSGVRVTSVGKQIIDQARRVLASAAAIEDLASAGDNHLNAPLILGTPNTIGPYLLPRCVIQLEKENCPLRLHAQEGDSATLIDRLSRGDLDAAIITQNIRTADILVQSLFNEPFVAVMTTQHRLAILPSITPDALKQEPLRPAPYESGLYQQIREALPALKDDLDAVVHPNVNTEIYSLEMVRAMLSAVSGIAIMPLAAALTMCSGSNILTFRSFSDVHVSRPVALAWRASYPRHKAIDVIRRVILTCKPSLEACVTEPELLRSGLLVDNKFW
jgi:LysR family hydrogen peroxide-inducible transcriptional activator